MIELIRSLTHFGGTLNEDVVKWLRDMQEIFDRAELQPSNKYLAAQYYLTMTAVKWFRCNKSNTPDWSTFSNKTIKAFRLLTLAKISSTSKIPQKENENENHEIDLMNDNQIKRRSTI